MKDITSNEMMFVLNILKSPEINYNANSMASVIGISRMGALKIARKLEQDNIIISRKWGKAKFYSLNFDSDYVRDYVKFLLKREAKQSHPYVKVWIEDIRKIKSADAAIIFGSVLRKYKDAGDIDVMLLINPKNYHKIQKEIHEIDELNTKKIHPMYQTKEDLIKNLKKEDLPLLSAIKGIAAFGEDIIINAIKDSLSK